MNNNGGYPSWMDPEVWHQACKRITDQLSDEELEATPDRVLKKRTMPVYHQMMREVVAQENEWITNNPFDVAARNLVKG